MSFLVTALKWRPQKFEEVVGQEHISVTLRNAIKNNRIAHAYIFAGPRGVGKTTSARIFARSINCTNPQDGEPCNVCEMCEAFKSSQSLDIIEIDGASNRRIDEIRTLRESVKYSPTKGKYKVYIIDEVHMLTTESFNALLKTLEEPPEHTIFIFATTDIHKVPLTIISRCQRYDFRRIELSTIKDLLLKIAIAEDIKIDDRSLTLIAKKADGALRDAESLFDQVVSFCGNNVDVEVLSKMLNLIDDEVYFTLSDAILEKKYNTAFEITKKIYENGWNFIDFGYGLLEHFRNILTTVIRKDTELIESADIYVDRYLAYSDKFSEGDLLRITAFLNKLQYELKTTSNQRLKIELGLAHLIGLEKSATISEVIEKLNAAEPKISNVTTEKKKPKVDSESKNETKRLEQDTNFALSASFNKHIENDKEHAKSDELNPTEEDNEIPAYNKPENIDPSNYQQTWNQIIEQILYEKKLLGFLLKNSLAESFNDNTLNVLLLKADYDQISSNHSYITSVVKEYFGSKSEISFSPNLTKEKLKNTDIKIEDEYLEVKDTELTKAIKEHLGATEIKSGTK